MSVHAILVSPGYRSGLYRWTGRKRNVSTPRKKKNPPRGIGWPIGPFVPTRDNRVIERASILRTRCVLLRASGYRPTPPHQPPVIRLPTVPLSYRFRPTGQNRVVSKVRACQILTLSASGQIRTTTNVGAGVPKLPTRDAVAYLFGRRPTVELDEIC